MDAFDELLDRIVLFLPTLVTGVLVFLAFWIAAAVLQRVTRRVLKGRVRNPDVVNLLVQFVEIALLVFGAITALGTLGIDIAALVAGLGLTGFALGFALKDAISNLLAGVLLLVYEPFQRADRITISDTQGTVTEINLRYTVLNGTDKYILVPNSKLLTEIVTVEEGGVPNVPPVGREGSSK